MYTQTLHNSHIALAIYREIAAHLQQISGVSVFLIPQDSDTFDYQLSQVKGLTLSYEPSISPDEEELVEKILAYYAQQYGSWRLANSQQQTANS